jgi:hypothetical protein
VRPFLGWRAVNPVALSYTPALGWKILDRTILNAAEFVAPVYRTALRGLWGGSTTDGFSDVAAIRGVLDGNYSGTLGPQAVQTGLGWATLDVFLTALTVVPLGSGARGAISGGRFLPTWGVASTWVNPGLSGLRHLTILGGTLAASALTMAAVEVSPLPKQYRGAVRFVLGLAAGFGAGVGLSNAWRPFESGIPSLTARLGRILARVKEVEDKLAKAGGSTAALLKQRQALLARAAEVKKRLDALYKLGGAEVGAAEQALQTAQDNLRGLLEAASAPGLAPSARAAKLASTQVRAAQKAVADASAKLAKAYNKVDVLAAANGISAGTLGVSLKNGMQVTFGAARNNPWRKLADLPQTVRDRGQELVKKYGLAGVKKGQAVHLKKPLSAEDLLAISEVERREFSQIVYKDGAEIFRGGPTTVTSVVKDGATASFHTHGGDRLLYPSLADLASSRASGLPIEIVARNAQNGKAVSLTYTIEECGHLRTWLNQAKDPLQEKAAQKAFWTLVFGKYGCVLRLSQCTAAHRTPRPNRQGVASSVVNGCAQIVAKSKDTAENIRKQASSSLMTCKSTKTFCKEMLQFIG